MMTSEQWQALKAGDVVTRKCNGEGYIIIGTAGGSVLQAVRVIGMIDPKEWNIGEARRGDEVYDE
jgi:hypothetical protein